MSKAVLYNQSFATQTSNSDTGNISWGNSSTIAVDVNVTGHQGTSPTLEIFVDRLGADGVTYFNMWDSTATSVSSASSGSPVVIKRSIGPGCSTTEEIAASGRVRWVIGGSSTPGCPFSISVQGE